MANFIMATCLKYIIKTDKITLDVCIRIGNGIAYSCLCCKINYNLRPVLVKYIINSIIIGNGILDKYEMFAVFVELFESFIF